MLEYLFFRTGGYFEGERVLIIRNHDGMLSLDHFLFLRGNGASIPHCHAAWTKQRSKRFISSFAALRCEEWEDQYCDNSTLDGTQWELRYKLEGQGERRISGSNAYPENWGSFLSWISDAVRKLPVKETVDADKALDAILKLTSAAKR